MCRDASLRAMRRRASSSPVRPTVELSFVSPEKRPGAELLGRALLAPALLERLLRLLLLLLLWLVGTLAHGDLRAFRSTQRLLETTRGWPCKSNPVRLGSYVSRAIARREVAGFRPGFWQQGQFKPSYSYEPLALLMVC